MEALTMLWDVACFAWQLAAGGDGPVSLAWVSWIPAAANVASSLFQAKKAGDAADAAAEASGAGIAEQRRQFDLTRSDYAPWREAGQRALGTLESDINAPLKPADVMSEPGYQFGLDQGQLALDRKQSALGGRAGGAALKAAARWGGDYATTRYDAAYQRRQDRLNRLAALAGIGQTATTGTAAAGANSANQISSLLQNSGNMAAGAEMAKGNIWGNAFNNVSAQLQRNPNALNSLFDSTAALKYSSPSWNSFDPGIGVPG